MEPKLGIILLALVVALIAIEILSNRAMKKLGIEPSPSAKWLRIVNIVAVVGVIGFSLWVIWR